MKLCRKCNTEKAETEFNKNSHHKDGLQNNCKLCVSEHHKGWYQKNKDRVKQHTKAHKRRLQERVLKLKKSLSCAFCGESETVCLDFHHKNPDEKDFSISEISYKNQAWSTILAEIDKCVCVCSNCHRKIHAGIITLGP